MSILIEIILNRTAKSVQELRCYNCVYSQIKVMVHDHVLRFSQQVLFELFAEREHQLFFSSLSWCFLQCCLS